MTHSALKTIAAFQNTEGGTLYVGVSDSGEILGIEQDGFPNEDKFLLHLNNVVKDWMGQSAPSRIDPHIWTIGGKEICRIECRPSTIPVFLKFQGKESFYVRTGPSTEEMTPSEMHSYMSERFPAEEMKFLERPFAYEFYHQLRKLIERDEVDIGEAVIQGEVDKTYQHLFESRCIPDFIIHVSNQQGWKANLAVIEIKLESNRREIPADFKKLIAFAEHENLQYQRVIQVIIGSQDRLETLAEKLESNSEGRIECYLAGAS